MPAGLTGKPGRGDPLQLPAQSVSSFMDAAAAHRASQHSQRQESFPSRLRGGYVIVQNNTGSDRDQFDACAISGAALTPDAADDSRNTVVTVDTPATDDDSYICILQEPIAAGACGLALVVGITLVNMQRASGDNSDTVGVAAGQHYLQSGGSSAQILWEASDSGTHLAVVRLPLGAAQSQNFNWFATADVATTQVPRGGSWPTSADGVTLWAGAVILVIACSNDTSFLAPGLYAV